jgi:GNAT superfamily N-acetyltransferase
MADMDRIGEINADSWRERLGDILPAAVLDSLHPADLALVWAGGLINPPTPAHRILVAVTSGDIAGYAAIGPSADPDADPVTGELLALEVDPRHQRRGHGSRLMAAAVDAGRALGNHSMTAWCAVQDEVRRAFLQSAGWAPDAAVRDLAVADPHAPDLTLREVRLTTDIR